MQNTKKAFSLVEILVGLIIISVVMAAFAPTMNKKVQRQKAALSTRITDKCADIGLSPDCILCHTSPKKCITCRNECTQDQKLDFNDCVCK